MRLNSTIDMRNSNTYLQVNHFRYPVMTPDMNKTEDCWFCFKINFADFKPDSSDAKISSKFTLDLGKHYLLQGTVEPS